MTTKIRSTKGWRSRGWTPMAYPPSALASSNESSCHFPLHQDILLAASRELLIMDGILDKSTLKVGNGNVKEELASDDTGCKKRKLSTEDLVTRKKQKKADSRMTISNASESAFELANTMVGKSRILTEESTTSTHIVVSSDSRPPRKVSEADQELLPTEQAHITSEPPIIEAYEISGILDLSQRNESGAYVSRKTLHASDTALVHVSIPSEALLRDAAVTMTDNLVQNISHRALRYFLGYKAPSIPRSRLIQLLASFLFDTSHAMYAWQQTEQDFLVAHKRDHSFPNLDDMVRKSLFDARALKKIGGFHASGLLPQALNISRVRRRRDVSWESFAETVEGRRELAHHASLATVLKAGKIRRGQRLRQRHWLTSDLLEQPNPVVSEDECQSRSRSSSFATSSEDSIDDEELGENSTSQSSQTRILRDMPRSQVLQITKESSGSWGVGLAKEGDVCVVGKAVSPSFLKRGDLILHVQNAKGQQVYSPLCSWAELSGTQSNWYGNMVDLFKTSQELSLIIQRV